MKDSLQPLAIYYEDGKTDYLRVPSIAVTRDLTIVISTLASIGQIEPTILNLIYNKSLIADNMPPYKIAAIGGDIFIEQRKFVNLAESHLDIAASLLPTFSGEKVQWRKMMFAPMQVFELFFTDKIFVYIDDEAKLILYDEEEEKDKKENPFDYPQNEFESWCYSYASMLRMGKTPRGAKELMSLTRGEIAGITKFWNITEKKLHPDLSDGKDKPVSEMTEKEKLKALEEIKKKQLSRKMLANKDLIEQERSKLFNPDLPNFKGDGKFRRKKLGEQGGSIE